MEICKRSTMQTGIHQMRVGEYRCLMASKHESETVNNIKRYAKKMGFTQNL